MNEPDPFQTPKQLRELVRKLDRKDIVNWLPEMKLGKPAYEHLKATLLSADISENQVRNILHALFQLRFHGTSEEVMQIYMDFAADDRIAVRSKAVQLALGLSALSRHYPRLAVPLKHEDVSRIEAALRRGVDPQTLAFARKVLEESSPDDPPFDDPEDKG